MPRVAVVVAKFEEDVSWTAALPAEWDVFTYDKSDGTIPNVGREAETYARFLSERYDELPAWEHVVFLQGNPFDHALPPHDDVWGVQELAGLGTPFVSDGDGKPDHEGLPVSRAHALVFGEDAAPAQWHFFGGAQYVVPVPCITRRPKEFWTRLHGLLAAEQVCAWAMERLWPCAFRPRAQWGRPVHAFTPL